MGIKKSKILCYLYLFRIGHLDDQKLIDRSNHKLKILNFKLLNYFHFILYFLILPHLID